MILKKKWKKQEISNVLDMYINCMTDISNSI